MLILSACTGTRGDHGKRPAKNPRAHHPAEARAPRPGHGHRASRRRPHERRAAHLAHEEAQATTQGLHRPLGEHADPGPGRLIDLHTHSRTSDGTLSPAELVAHAAARGVELLSLTDHDTLEGTAEAAEAAARAGLRFVAGVEVSVSWQNKTLHVVGLDVDPGNAALKPGLARLQSVREERAREIGRRLEAKGIEGAYAGAERLAAGAKLTRTHFARFLHQA